MALERDKLTIDIELESGDANKAIEKLAESLKGLSKDTDMATDSTEDLNESLDDNKKETKKATKESKTFGSTLLNTAASITAVNQALEIAKKAYSVIKGAVDTTTDAFAVQEKAELDLANALKLQGEFTEKAFQDFKDFASELQNTTTVGDETTLGLLKIAKALNLTNDQSKQAVEAAAALSAATGQDLNSSFQQVTKTFGGFAGELGEKLPALRELSKEQLQAGEATKLLIDQFGGFAEASRNTFSGQQIATANAFGDVLEEIGELFVNVFDLGGSAKELEQFFITIGGEIDSFRQKLVFVLDNVDFNKIIEPLKTIAMVIGTLLLPVLIKISIPLGLIALKFVAISAAIAGVIVVVDLLVRNMGQISTVFGAVGDIIAAAFNKGAASIAEFVSFLFGKLKELIETVNDLGILPDSLADSAMSSLDSFTSAADSAMQNFDQSASEAAENAKASFDQLGDKGLLGGLLDTVSDVKGSLSELSDIQQQQANDALQSDNDQIQSTKNLINQKKVLSAVEQARLSTTESILAKNQDIANQIALAGLEGEELAAKQLEIELAKIDALMIQLEAQGKLSEDGRAALLAQKKLVTELSEAKGARSKGAGATEGKRLSKAEDEGVGSMVQKIVGAIVEGAEFMVDSFMSAVDFFEGVSEQMVIGLQKMGNVVIDGMRQLPNMLMAMVEALEETLEAFVTELPKILAKIIDMLPEMIDRVFAALNKFFQRIPIIFRQIAEALPGMITQVMNALPELLTSIIRSIPQMIIPFIQALPDVLINIMERLPQITATVIEELIAAAGDIAVALVDELIAKGGALRIAEAFVKALLRSFGAIVTGLSKGLQRAFKSIFGGLTLPPLDAEPFKDSVKEVVDAASKGAGKVAKEVFGLIDLPEAGKGKGPLGDAGEQISKAIETAGKRINGLWQSFLSGLEKTWKRIWDKYLKPIYQLVRRAWLFVFNFFTETLPNALKSAWAFVMTFFTETLPNALKSAWAFVMTFFTETLPNALMSAWAFVMTFFNTLKERVFDPIARVLSGIFDGLKERIFDPIINGLKTVLEPFISSFKSILDGLMSVLARFNSFFAGLRGIIDHAFKFVTDTFHGLKGTVDNAFKFVTDTFHGLKGTVQDAFGPITDAFKTIASPFEKLAEALNKFKMPSLPSLGGGGGGGVVGQVVDTAKTVVSTVTGGLFNDGGLVTGPGFVETPGEFVFKKEAVEKIGAPTLQSINNTGQMPGMGGNKNVVNIESGAININMVEGDSPQDIAERVIEEITRQTLDGRGIIFTSGVRAS